MHHGFRREDVVGEGDSERWQLVLSVVGLKRLCRKQAWRRGLRVESWAHPRLEGR